MIFSNISHHRGSLGEDEEEISYLENIYGGLDIVNLDIPGFNTAPYFA